MSDDANDLEALITEALAELLDRIQEIRPDAIGIEGNVHVVYAVEDDEEEGCEEHQGEGCSTISSPAWVPGAGFPLLHVPDDDGTIN